MPNGMSQEIIEIAFLLLIAFLIGCAIGYLLRYVSLMPTARPVAAPAPVQTPEPVAKVVTPAAIARPATPAIPSTAQRLAATATDPPPIEAVSTAPQPAAKPVAQTKPASPKPIEAAKEPAPAAAISADGKPSALVAPRDGKKDNLRQIKGIGPKTETTLNELGVFHFDQIVAWDPKTVAWVNQHLSFSGRIERDDWIGQARNLAAGGAPLPKK
jgi:predicted flap endonuclease-1-like 5' DNA nuclease